MRLVGHEEVIEMPRNKSGGSRVPRDDLYDVIAVEVSSLPQEYLLAVVMVLRPVLELEEISLVRVEGWEGLMGPAGECSGGLLNVILGVVANPHGEELKELPAPVLVDGALMIIPVVQVDYHCGVSSQVR